MKIISFNNVIVFPLAYDLFCKDMDSIVECERDNTCIAIKRMMNEVQAREIKEIILKMQASDPCLLFVLDFSNITSVSDRVLGRYFSETSNILIVNISNHPNLIKRIEEDLKRTVVNGCVCLDCSSINGIVSEIKMENVYHGIDIQILKGITSVLREDQIDGIKPLDSSGVYSNMYVDTARLFFDAERYRFIIYRIINKIIEKDNIERIDAFVSASRIGANLANVIGWLMGKKVIFCNNIGPKYSLTLQYLLEDIRPKKKYTYIFDVMCLGTEAKLLNTILTVKGAVLRSAYGIASYNEDNFIRNLETLVNLKDKEINYRISGDKENLRTILRGEFVNEIEYKLSEM